MIRIVVSYIAVLLGAISYGLGTVICWAAHETLRPRQGVHLMFWHVLAVTFASWGFHTLFLLRVVSDLDLFDSISFLPGVNPQWHLIVGTILLVLNDVAFWIILKVQRGRRQLQRAARAAK